MNLILTIMLGALPMQMTTKPAFHAHNDYLHARPLFDALLTKVLIALKPMFFSLRMIY